MVYIFQIPLYEVFDEIYLSLIDIRSKIKQHIRCPIFPTTVCPFFPLWCQDAYTLKNIFIALILFFRQSFAT